MSIYDCFLPTVTGMHVLMKGLQAPSAMSRALEDSVQESPLTNTVRNIANAPRGSLYINDA